MPGILDRVAQSASRAKLNSFLPACPEEFFALQLARRLGEPEAVRHYVGLLDHYSLEVLRTAFRRSIERGSHTGIARSFHDELDRLQGRMVDEIKTRRLGAIRVDRRAIAVVILTGYHQNYPPLVRQLPSDPNKAENSAAVFVSKVLQKCPFATAAFEALPATSEVQRQSLINTICTVLAEHEIGVWPVERSDILAAFGYPALKSRRQIHEVVQTMWPDINGSFGAHLVRDALALGLYCQTEYLFNF